MFSVRVGVRISLKDKVLGSFRYLGCFQYLALTKTTENFFDSFLYLVPPPVFY